MNWLLVTGMKNLRSFVICSSFLFILHICVPAYLCVVMGDPLSLQWEALSIFSILVSRA